MRDLEMFEGEGEAYEAYESGFPGDGAPALELPGPRPRPRAPSCRLKEVLDRFAQNSSTLTPVHLSAIRRIAACIRSSQRTARPIRNIRVVGHASTEGPDRYNLALGQRRADAVLGRLRTELGPLAARVLPARAQSEGERRPLGRGRELDRRVEIFLPRVGGRRPVPPRRRGCAPQRERVRLHLKILAAPTMPIARMIAAMRQVYHPAGIRVDIASTERLSLPALVDLDIRCPGSATAMCCPFPCATPTQNAEVVQLFQNRNNVRGRDVVVYFVRSTFPVLGGCCSHPPGRPGAVVTSIANEWVMAHEVAHVLGLAHVADPERLMFANFGPGLPPHPPPDLIPAEVQTMMASALTVPC